jgi:hypothetical protein
MTYAQIEAITGPANGLIVFNTDDGKMYIYILADNKWKEVQYGSGEIILPASYTIGTGGSCSNTTVNGNYYEGLAFDGTNTVTLYATVSIIGSWSMTTNTVNGYSFSGSGTFSSTGTVQVTLYGTGTPVTAQTDNFTTTADNSGGTCTFSVLVSPAACGSTTSITYGGQTYSVISIGTQCWMAENLNIGTWISLVDDQTDNDIIEKYCYDDDPYFCDIYGGLYQWNEAMQYVTTEGTQGICPTDWHLPTDEEWTTLTDFLGGSSVRTTDPFGFKMIPIYSLK